MRTLSALLRASLLLTVLLAGVYTAQAQQQPLPPGERISDALQTSLTRTDGAAARPADLKGSAGTVFVFYANQCVWTDRYAKRLADLATEFGSRGISFVFVNANDSRSGDFPKESAAESAKQNLPGPYLMDPTAAFANALGAERAPQVFVIDGNDVIVYTGAIDDSPGDPGNVKKAFLREVLTSLSTGAAVTVAPTNAIGCLINKAQ